MKLLVLFPYAHFVVFLNTTEQPNWLTEEIPDETQINEVSSEEFISFYKKETVYELLFMEKFI